MRILKYDIEKVTGIPWKKKKSYRYLYRLACREDVIKKAFKRMRKGKTKRKDFQMAEENLDTWVKKIQEIILNTKPDGWQTDPQKRFKPVKHNPVIIKEFGKTRVVYVPTMVELWIQHVIVMILEPIIAGSSYPMSFSSFPGRGSLKGQRAIRRWIESGKGIRNFAQADIRHFYSHIQYKIVRKKLERRVKDSFFLHLIDVCMTYFPKEMPLGFYLSQWLANFMLQELDYDIKCKLKIAHHVRYMDNYTLADDNKKKLHQALLYIRQALGKMRLRMKNDWQVFRFEYTKKNGKKTGRCVSAMGWLFYRSKVLIRKHILLHVERIARKLHKKEENGQRFPLGLCRGFVSLLGWITHSETYDWSKTYKDMFDENKILSAYSDETERFEAHHIIPLGTVKKVGESTKKLRDDEKNICNSPLNFVYITKKANKEISDESLKDYVQKINAEAKAKLHITAYTNSDIPQDQVKQILRERYDFLKGDIRERISTLLS